MRLDLSTYAEIEEYLSSKNSIIIPIGSIEQHSPDGILGTDHLIAQALAQAVGKRLQIAVAPALPVGIALHHMSFPGTISLKPKTFILYIQEIIQSLVSHGFEQFLFINGHGGNIQTLQAAFAQLTGEHRIKFDVASWWHLPEVKAMEEELFGEENGQHATASEISITRFLYPEAFQDSRGFDKPFAKTNYDLTIPEYAWPLSAEGFREIFPFGNIGSNPTIATTDKGRTIFTIAVDALCEYTQYFLEQRY